VLLTGVSAALGAPSQVGTPGFMGTVFTKVASGFGAGGGYANFAKTLGAWAALGLGGSQTVAKLAGNAAAGVSEGAAYGAAAIVGGTVGLYVGSAINCR